MNKAAKIISNIVYGLGAAVTVTLGCIALFGPTRPVVPGSMLELSWRDQAFVWLAFGAIPMVLACMAVYKFNGIKNTAHKKRAAALIFLPGLVCAACAAYWVVVIMIGYVNMIIHGGPW